MPAANLRHDPRGGGHHVMGAVKTLNCGDGRGVNGVTTTTTRKQISVLAPMSASAPTVAVMTAITRHPSPKRWRIAGPSRESRCKSSDDSAEGGYRRRRHDNEGRTPTTATESGESGRGRKTKATNKSGQP